MPPRRPPINHPALCVVFAEPDLTLSSKGLLAYLLSRPPRVVTRAELFRQNRDGMPMVDASIRELEAAGFVMRVPTRTRDGMREGGGIQLVQP